MAHVSVRDAIKFPIPSPEPVEGAKSLYKNRLQNNFQPRPGRHHRKTIPDPVEEPALSLSKGLS
jgi:hypothetical protein